MATDPEKAAAKAAAEQEAQEKAAQEAKATAEAEVRGKADSSVKANFDNLPKGDPIAVPGVGEVPNGSSVKVDQFQIEMWENFTGEKWPKDGLVLPAPTTPPADTAAQNEAALQTEILERQNARSPEEVLADSAKATAQILRGNLPPTYVDGVPVGFSNSTTEK